MLVFAASHSSGDNLSETKNDLEGQQPEVVLKLLRKTSKHGTDIAVFDNNQKWRRVSQVRLIFVAVSRLDIRARGYAEALFMVHLAQLH